MSKKYLLYTGTDKVSFIIRKEFQKFLTKSEFIEDIHGDEEAIIEEKDDNDELIQAVKVDLTLNENIKAVWRVNLEQEIEGISTKNILKLLK